MTAPTLRILHTADWHLGVRVGGQDRLPDQVARLEELIAHAEEQRADVLLVCGDVLEGTRPQQLTEAVSELARLLKPGIERGMQCVFLRGNHDSQHTFALLEGMQRLLADDTGRVHFVSAPTLLPLTAAGEPAAALIALPYPSPAAYPSAAGAVSVDEKQASLQRAVGEAIEQLTAAADAELPGLPKVMAGHFLLREAPAETDTGREVPEAEEVRIESPRLGDFAYVALGHIHQPTDLADHVRYSGALDRLDFGEAGEDRHALLAEIGGEGAVAVRELGLDPTPLAVVDAGSLAELEEQAELLAEPERTIVKLTLRLGRDDSPIEWLATARERFPRIHDRPDVVQLDDPLPSMLTGELERADVGQTVRDYLSDQLEADPDRDELLALASELLDEQAAER